MTIKQLEIFVAVAKYANMSTAAESLFLTQSACSMAISSLENALNGLIFERHNKKLSLNERGRILLPKAHNILAQVTDAQNAMLDLRPEHLAGHLIIGASSTIGNYILPSLIGKFVTDYSQIEATLKVANTEEIIQKTLDFSIDLGIIEGKCSSKEIETSDWIKDELIIIAPSRHPLVKKSSLTLKDLSSAKWILREPGSGTRETFEEAVGYKIKPFLEFGHTEAIKQAVQSGIGLSCVSRTTVLADLKNKSLIELKTPFLHLHRSFKFIIHKNKYQSAALMAFINACKNIHL